MLWGLVKIFLIGCFKLLKGIGIFIISVKVGIKLIWFIGFFIVVVGGIVNLGFVFLKFFFGEYI